MFTFPFFLTYLPLLLFCGLWSVTLDELVVLLLLLIPPLPCDGSAWYLLLLLLAADDVWWWLSPPAPSSSSPWEMSGTFSTRSLRKSKVLSPCMHCLLQEWQNRSLTWEGRASKFYNRTDSDIPPTFALFCNHRRIQPEAFILCFWWNEIQDKFESHCIRL